MHQYIPKRITEYREPFVGGASGILYHQQRLIKPAKIIKASDANADLINFWKAVQVNPTALYNRILDWINKYDAMDKLWNEIRYIEHLHSLDDLIDKAAVYYLVHKISFSGAGYASNGGMSGKYYNADAYDILLRNIELDKFQRVSKMFDGIDIRCADYVDLLLEDGKGVFIYLDPPYSNVSNLYGDRGEYHNNFDFYKLRDNLEKANHKWLMTLDDSTFVRDLFQDFSMIEFYNPHKTSRAKKENMKESNGMELLISNYARF